MVSYQQNAKTYSNQTTYCSFYFLLNLDPPTYEQAKILFERKFAPNYPVYRRQTSYSSQTNTPVLRRHCNP